MKSPKHQGIVNLEGREPVGAVLSIGVKDATKGFPTETDRFHFVNPRENGGVRALHISFYQYNNAPAEKRRVIHGNIVHGTREKCFEFYLKAQVLKKAHPDRKPCCFGDGEKATRWMGGESDNFKEIDCPNDKCEFRQTKPPLCKPFMRFLFRPRWDKSNGFSGMPELLVKFTSGAWSTTSNMKGFFEYIEKTAKELGMQQYTLFGFPFMMTLAYQTKPSDKSRFPVVTITPEADPVSFFMKQRENIRLLNSPASVPIAITSGEEQAIEVLYEDVRGIDGAPVSIPSRPEKPSTPPVEHKSQPVASKETPKPEKSTPATPEASDNGKNWHVSYFPEDWGKVREKMDKAIESKWKDLQSDTLATMIAGKGEQKKLATYELYFRIITFGELYKKVGQSEDWNGAIGGDLEKIPAVELANVVKQLNAGWHKLSEKK